MAKLNESECLVLRTGKDQDDLDWLGRVEKNQSVRKILGYHYKTLSSIDTLGR